jgi:hypothetical protein
MRAFCFAMCQLENFFASSFNFASLLWVSNGGDHEAKLASCLFDLVCGCLFLSCMGYGLFLQFDAAK